MSFDINTVVDDVGPPAQSGGMKDYAGRRLYSGKFSSTSFTSLCVFNVETTANSPVIVKPRFASPRDIPGEVAMAVLREMVDISIRDQLDSCQDQAASLVAVSQANRSWRQLALSMPELWSQVLQPHVNSPMWFKTLMARARTYPFSVISGIPVIGKGMFTLRSKEIHQNWDLVFLNFHRCKHFFARLGNAPYWNPFRLKTILTKPAPLLQSFTILQDGPCFYGCPFLERDNVVFGGNSPSLRTFQMRGHYPLIMFQQPAIFPPPRLTHLVVHCQGQRVPVIDEQNFTHIRWHRILRHLPFLTTLVLQNTIFLNFPSPDNHSDDSVNSFSSLEDDLESTPTALSHLRSLKVVGYSRPCYAFLRGLCYPRSCSVDVVMVQGEGISDDDIHGIGCTLVRCLSTLCLVGDHLAIRWRGGLEVSVKEGEKYSFRFIFDWPALTLKWYHHSRDVILKELIGVLRILERDHRPFLCSVRSVTLSMDSQAETPEAISQFCRTVELCTSVEALHLNGPLSESTLPIIHAQFHPRTDPDILEHYLPQLKTVTFLASSFVESISLVSRHPCCLLAHALSLRSHNPNVSPVTSVVLVSDIAGRSCNYRWVHDLFPSLVISSPSELSSITVDALFLDGERPIRVDSDFLILDETFIRAV